jgi:hypothetical protein
MIKILRIICLALLICFGGIVIFGKLKIKTIDYQNTINESMYVIIDDYYDMYPNLTKIIVDDDQILNVNDLIQKSDYVLKVETMDKIDFAGGSLINNCQVQKVIKGENLKQGDTIKVYDHMMGLNNDSINYFAGAIPLKEKTEYIVFLKKAPNPNRKGTYIFSSVKYGSFRITDDLKIVTNYENYSLPVNEVINYDYITLENSDDEIYNNISKQIYQQYSSDDDK